MIWEVFFTPRGFNSLPYLEHQSFKSRACGRQIQSTLYIPAKPVHNFPPPSLPSIPMNYEAFYGRFSASKLGGRCPQSNPTWFMYQLRLRKNNLCGLFVCFQLFFAKLSFQASGDIVSVSETQEHLEHLVHFDDPPCKNVSIGMYVCRTRLRKGNFFSWAYWRIQFFGHCLSLDIIWDSWKGTNRLRLY